MPAIVVVSTDDLLVQLIDVSLSRAGYDVLAVSTLHDAIRAPMTAKVSVAVLDGAMPTESLEPITSWMRSGCGSAQPVKLIFVASAKTRASSLPIDPEIDQLLVKPLTPEQIRKSVEDSIIQSKSALSDKLIVGSFEIDRKRQSFSIQGQQESIALTKREFDLLEYLAMRPGELVSTQELVANVWHRDPANEDGSIVRSQMQLLRRKLGDLVGEAQLIESFPRRGYRLNVD